MHELTVGEGREDPGSTQLDTEILEKKKGPFNLIVQFY